MKLSPIFFALFCASTSFQANAWGWKSSSSEDVNVNQLTSEALQLAQTASVDEIKDKAVNYAVSSAESSIEQSMQSLIPTFELSVSGVTNGKPTIGALGLAPLYETENDLFFTQFSFFNNDNRQTVNLGLGYRQLAMDDNLLWGINAFYDHEFPYDHQRASVGAELRTTVAELNTNFYEALSGTKVGRDSRNEEAMDGFDIEAGLTSQHIRETDLFARFGGEEFVIIMPFKTRQEALTRFELIRAAIKSLRLNYNEEKVSLTVSIGMTHVTESDKTLEHALKRADIALYKAKAAGRDTIIYE